MEAIESQRNEWRNRTTTSNWLEVMRPPLGCGTGEQSMTEISTCSRARAPWTVQAVLVAGMIAREFRMLIRPAEFPSAPDSVRRDLKGGARQSGSTRQGLPSLLARELLLHRLDCSLVVLHLLLLILTALRDEKTAHGTRGSIQSNIHTPNPSARAPPQAFECRRAYRVVVVRVCHRFRLETLCSSGCC